MTPVQLLGPLNAAARKQATEYPDVVGDPVMLMTRVCVAIDGARQASLADPARAG
jgi:hypothetical protein